MILLFYSIFRQINAWFVSIRNFLNFFFFTKILIIANIWLLVCKYNSICLFYILNDF